MHQLTSIAGLIFVPIAPFLLNKDTLIVALLCCICNVVRFSIRIMFCVYYVWLTVE